MIRNIKSRNKRFAPGFTAFRTRHRSSTRSRTSSPAGPTCLPRRGRWAPGIADLGAVPLAKHRHCRRARGADVALALAASFRHRQSDAHGHEHASACAIEALADALEHRTYAMCQ